MIRHVAQGIVCTGEVRTLHVGTEEQYGDVLTKALWRKIFLVHRAVLMNFFWCNTISVFSVFFQDLFIFKEDQLR